MRGVRSQRDSHALNLLPPPNPFPTLINSVCVYIRMSCLPRSFDLRLLLYSELLFFALA